MKIINRDKIWDFGRRHALARKPLARWEKVISESHFKSPVDMRKAFPTVSFVKGYAIFNIKGNDYRLVAITRYVEDVLSIEEIMTHADSDSWRVDL